MTTFKTYLTEEQESLIVKYIPNIKKECSDYIDMTKQTIVRQVKFNKDWDHVVWPYGLWRRRKSQSASVVKDTIRTDRRPTTTITRNSDIFDKVFEKQFGVKYRSNSVFAYGSRIISDNSMYGSTQTLIFPTNGFTFCCHL